MHVVFVDDSSWKGTWFPGTERSGMIKKCGARCWRMRQEQNTLNLLGHVMDFGFYPKRIWKLFGHFRQRNGMIRSEFKRDHYAICVGQVEMRLNAYFCGGRACCLSPVKYDGGLK